MYKCLFVAAAFRFCCVSFVSWLLLLLFYYSFICSTFLDTYHSVFLSFFLVIFGNIVLIFHACNFSCCCWTELRSGYSWQIHHLSTIHYCVYVILLWGIRSIIIAWFSVDDCCSTVKRSIHAQYTVLHGKQNQKVWTKASYNILYKSV